MNLDNYCLDTHPLVWYFLKQKTLSLVAEQLIRKIFRDEAVGVISTMVLLEAYYVSLKNKNFNFPKFMDRLSSSNIKIISFDKQVLAKSLLLPPRLDIHDRIIVATSIITNSRLITKDEVLGSLFPLETIW